MRYLMRLLILSVLFLLSLFPTSLFCTDVTPEGSTPSNEGEKAEKEYTGMAEEEAEGED